MNAKTTRHTRIILGLCLALGAGLFLRNVQNEPGDARQPDADTISASPIGVQNPSQFALDRTTEADVAETSTHTGLPADAKILPVERVTYLNHSMEVRAGEVLVQFSSSMSTEARDRLIGQLGSSILREDPTTGYLRLKVPENQTIMAFQGRLEMTEGVVSSRPNVLMRGTGNRCSLSGAYYGYQWNLSRFQHRTACETMPDDPTSIVIAVLDTGVAYENYDAYRQASDLENVTVVSPYDFINDDAHPNDDHQHGTHIATTILGAGRINGVTPGATLMPVKVLDAGNRGDEFALAQGIRWAVDHGADLINMSLSFPIAYVPSGILQESISYAVANDVLLIASSGNDGADTLPYPAAFRDVLSIGAVRMKKLENGDITYERASYSNYGPGLDLVAPGGSLSYDADDDGWPDGILAQTIGHNDPAYISYYFYAGTSQAAAQATGLAAWLMAAGATATEARDAMLENAMGLGDAGWDVENGQGLINVYAALNAFQSKSPKATRNLYANILPVVYRENGQEWGVARVKVADANGAPVANARVFGQWSGSAESKISAYTDADGYVLVESPAIDQSESGSIFSLEINTVVNPVDGRRVKPKEFYYLSEGMAALLNGALYEDATQEALIAFEVDSSDTSFDGIFDLDRLARCFSVKAIGPSIGTPGVGIAFTPALIPGLEDDSLPKDEITIEFGEPKTFGNGNRSNDKVVVYSGGVGLAMSHMGRTGGVGLAMSHMGRLAGGVGLAMSHMGKLKMDSLMISGQSAGASAEMILNEDPWTFMSNNPTLDGTDVGEGLLETRFAANTTDSGAMEGIIAAQSAEEADTILSNELGMGSQSAELGEEALSLPVSTDPEQL